MFTVSTLKSNESKEIAKIHIEVFKGFFLTELGPFFLNKYYKCVIRNSKGISLCVKNDGKIIGFIIGCTVSKGFNKRLVISNPFVFIQLGFKILLSNYKHIIRLLKNTDKQTADDDGNYGEILSFAVKPEYKGTGIGKMLNTQFEFIAKEKGVIRISLTTDLAENDSVLNIYHKLGYAIFYKFITYPNRSMYRLIKNI